MFRKITLHLFFAAIVGLLSVQAKPLHYSLQLSINLNDSTIQGYEIIENISLADSTEFNLSLTGLTIDSIRSDRNKSGYTRRDEQLLLDHSNFSSLYIWYHGKPTKGLVIKPTEFYTGFYTEGWMICDARPSTKALFDLTLTLPTGLNVVASGMLINKVDKDSNRTYHFQESIPISAYVFGFAGGKFRESSKRVDGTTIRILSNTFSDQQRDSIFTITAKALKYFEKITGKQYPWDSYTEVFTDADNEQEVAGFSLLANEYIKSVLEEPREDWLLIHELAHQWIGNSITCKSWSDFWLNEGLVTFLTASFKETESGRQEYDRDMVLSRKRYQKLRFTSRERPIVWDRWKRSEDMAGVITYYKGALVLNYLRYQIGEKAFWKGLKSYASKYWMGSVTTPEFEKEFEIASEKHLTNFFHEWVYAATAPILSAKYKVAKDSVEITLVQDSVQFILPMIIAIETKEKREHYAITLSKPIQSYKFPVAEKLLNLRLDDGGHLPILIHDSLPIQMLLYQATHEPDIFGRISALNALQDDLATMGNDERAQYRAELVFAEEHETSRIVKAIARSQLSALDRDTKQ